MTRKLLARGMALRRFVMLVAASRARFLVLELVKCRRWELNPRLIETSPTQSLFPILSFSLMIFVSRVSYSLRLGSARVQLTRWAYLEAPKLK
jgi:hypothetical protein